MIRPGRIFYNCTQEEFMLFFFPLEHREIDWTKQPEFLDKELQVRIVLLK
jgi:hypothetical protein